jgi:hypothetical protein
MPESGLPLHLVEPIAAWISDLKEVQDQLFVETGCYAEMNLVPTSDPTNAQPEGCEYDLPEWIPLPEPECLLAVVAFQNPFRGTWYRTYVRWVDGDTIMHQSFDEAGNATCAASIVDASNDPGVEVV